MKYFKMATDIIPVCPLNTIMIFFLVMPDCHGNHFR